VVRWALAHGVTPLVQRALEATDADLVPAEIRASLRSHDARNHARNLELVDELVGILEDLEQKGIPALPFKGPALAQLAYGALDLRLAGDLDLLVKVEDLDDVNAVLAVRGYLEEHEYETGQGLSAAEDARYRCYQGEYLFIRPGDGLFVEPHWAFVPRTLAVPIDYAGLFARSREQWLFDRAVLCPCPEDGLLALCLHGSKHQWTELRWISDLARFVEAHPELDWSACFERAREQACARMLRLGLCLAERVLGIYLPVGVRAAIARDRKALGLADVVWDRLFREERRAPSVFKLSRFRIRMRERARDRMVYVLRTLTTARIEHLRRVPLPPALRFLYPVATPAVDYLVLPVRRRLGGFWARRERERARTEALRVLERDAGAACVGLCAAWADRMENASRCLDEGVLAGSSGAPGPRLLDWAVGHGAATLGPIREVASLVAAGRGRPGLDEARGSEEAPRLVACTAAEQTLPFADESFDALVSRFGLQFCPSLEAALRECHRVLRPGARAGFLVWGPIESNTRFAVVQRVLREFFGKDVSGSSWLALEAERQLAAALDRAGFRNVEQQEIEGTEHIEPAIRFWQPDLEAMLGADVIQMPARTREALESALEAGFEPVLESGAYRIRTRVLLVIGTRSG
jgi:ubiquinone/menaquinone biosynthesis C-methylase UbiE